MLIAPIALANPKNVAVYAVVDQYIVLVNGSRSADAVRDAITGGSSAEAMRKGVGLISWMATIKGEPLAKNAGLAVENSKLRRPMLEARHTLQGILKPIRSGVGSPHEPAPPKNGWAKRADLST